MRKIMSIMLMMLLILLMTSFLTINAGEIPSEVEVIDGKYCLTEDQIIDLANHIEEQRLQIETLEERIEIERASFEDVIESKENTIELQDNKIDQLTDRSTNLEYLVEKREDQLQLTEEMLELEEKKVEELKSQRLRERLIFLGAGTLGILLVLN